MKKIDKSKVLSQENSLAKPFTLEDYLLESKKTAKIEKARKNGVLGPLWRALYGLQSLYYALRRFTPRYELKKVYWFFQRGFRGWSDSDTWSAQDHIAAVIIGCLKRLDKYKHGVPGDLCTPNVTVGSKKWSKILKHIIWTFETSQKASDGEVYLWCFEISDKKNKAFHKAMKEARSKHKSYPMPKFFTKEETRRYYEGFDLLKQYFLSLWD